MRIPAELHSHLYGCLTVDDLYWLAGRRPWRKEIYRASYQRTYGKEPPLDEFFRQDEAGRALIAEHYLYLEPADFARFQTCFDLGIAVSHTDPDELAGVLERVCAREPAEFVEYRQMFSPFLEREEFARKVSALALACDRVDRADGNTTPRLAISIARDDSIGAWQYEVVRELMAAEDAAARMIVGLDFCAMEEGHPPRAKRDLFERIHADNRRDPGRALAILYHVGESFQDKSVESAARWVVEAARMGAHRLGHCVALGVPPEFFAGTTRREIPGERRDQIEFELANARGLRKAGYAVDEARLGAELRELRALIESNETGGTPAPTVSVTYDDERVERLGRFQQWAMAEVRKTGAVVESCPTSNLRIAGLGRAENHPLLRFLAAGLPVVLGADDPGILNTDLRREFELVREWGVSAEQTAELFARAKISRSEVLSGRRGPNQ